MRDDLLNTIRQFAREEGFARVGVAPAEPVERYDDFLHWIGRGCHAEMAYLERNLPQRQRPDVLVEGARSVICLAVSYAPGPGSAAPRFGARQAEPAPAGACGITDEGPHRAPATTATATTASQACQSGLVAAYARGRDYHKVLKDRCIRLMDRIRDVEPSFAGRAFVDSAPIMERSLAVRAGLGWIGENGCLVVPHLGSYVLLAEIVCNLDLPAGEPIANGCDDCGRCSAACPTSAILPDGLIDCRRCVSYLTIEHRGPIDAQYWRRIGARIFGCDACQQACPHNKDVPAGDPELIGAAPPLAGATVGDVLQWTPQDWDLATRGSATRRATHPMFVRNAIIAAGNSGDRSLVEPLKALRLSTGHDPEMIDWAVQRLTDDVD